MFHSWMRTVSHRSLETKFKEKLISEYQSIADGSTIPFTIVRSSARCLAVFYGRSASRRFPDGERVESGVAHSVAFLMSKCAKQ
jgi:hypothetical protein